MVTAPPGIKPLVWIGSTRADLSAFPQEVKDAIGFALYVAQQGGKHAHAKPLRGFAGAGVLEVVADHNGDTYRAVYTVRFAGRVYVLHAFQKKSKTGMKTPKADINLINSRLKRAQDEHGEWLTRQKETKRHAKNDRCGGKQRQCLRRHGPAESRRASCESRSCDSCCRSHSRATTHSSGCSPHAEDRPTESFPSSTRATFRLLYRTPHAIPDAAWPRR